MSKIKAYNTLSELYKDENKDVNITHNEAFTIHRMEQVHKHPTTSPVFRANYFSFVLVQKGKSFYTIDQYKYKTKPNTLYFTNPGHLKSYSIQETVHGFLITTSEQFLKEHIHRKVFEEFEFLLTELVPPCYLESHHFQELYHLAEQIEETQHKKTALQDKIMSALFMVFLLRVKEHLLLDDAFKTELDRDSEIVQQFKIDLEAIFRSDQLKKHNLQVASFAKNQSLHPAYFSTVIKTKTGKSANQWVQKKYYQKRKPYFQNLQFL